MTLRPLIGSSNTWVGAGKQYVQTSTSKSTGNTVVSVPLPNGMTGVHPLRPDCQLWLRVLLRNRVYGPSYLPKLCTVLSAALYRHGHGDP